MAEVDRLAAMIDELLVLSPRGRGATRPREPVDLGDAARARRAALAPARAATPARAVGGRAAAPRLVRAAPTSTASLDALVENALAYGRAGTRRRSPAAGAVEVLDAGPGLAPGEEEAVFERFHRGARGPRAAGAAPASACRSRASWRARWGGDVTLADRREGGAPPGHVPAPPPGAFPAA